MLQRRLPLAVLKLKETTKIEYAANVATALTACGIETFCSLLMSC